MTKIYSNGMKTVDEFVNTYLLEHDLDEENYLRIKQLALKAIKHHNLHDNPIPVFRVVTLGSNLNEINLPDDFVELRSVSMSYKGKLWSFTEDNKLVITTSQVDGQEVFDVTEGKGIEIDNGTYQGYGARGGINRYYITPDIENNRIIVNGFPPAPVILEYISTGIRLDAETFIPIKAEEMYECWIDLKLASMDKKDGLGWFQEAKRSYKTARNEFRDLNWTLDQFKDIMYSTSGQAPKRGF